MIDIEKKILLKPPEATDLKKLYEWFSSEERYLWTNDRTHYSFSDFCESFHSKQHNYYYNFMIIWYRKSSEPIGFIYAYNYQQLNGYIYTTCFIEKNKRNLGLGAIAAVAYYDMWFREHPIVKICNEVFEYNQNSYSCLKGIFHLDGVLRCHRFYNRKYYDVYLFSILREEFYEWFDKNIIKKPDLQTRENVSSTPLARKSCKDGFISRTPSAW